MKRSSRRARAGALVLLPWLWCASPSRAQEAEPAAPLSNEELEQLVAPIALHPDDLLSQILMASTYPLEVVEAARWVAEHPDLEAGAAAKELEQQTWDPSVKSLVNFPDVLKAMDEKLTWMRKLGDAFLAQRDAVMKAIQRLRKKASDEGHLESTQEQNVTVEGDTIIVQSADPDVVYVPAYNTTVVYGAWPYPAYPPYAWYPPRPAPYYFATGVAVGLAWGYAWGHCDWHDHDVDVDVNRNVNRNTNINRDRYRDRLQRSGVEGGRGKWQHDPSHRRGVSYRDATTAQRYGRGGSPAATSRDAYRGRAEARAATRPTSGASQRPGTGQRPATGQRPSTTQRPSSSTRRPSSEASRPSTSRSSAFGSYDRGSEVRRQSSRGHASRQSFRGGGSRGGGGRGGRR